MEGNTASAAKGTKKLIASPKSFVSRTLYASRLESRIETPGSWEHDRDNKPHISDTLQWSSL